MTTTGKVAIVSPAIIGVYCTECCPVKYVNAMGSVLSSGLPIKIRENGNSFQASRKLKIVTVDKTGLDHCLLNLPWNRCRKRCYQKNGFRQPKGCINQGQDEPVVDQ